MTQTNIPVLIVGGGGAGLTASALLSRLGVDSLLVSALPTTSTLPKAHVLNQRVTLDRNLSPAAKIARKMARGGVGWYPDNHFIHLDSGPIRNWVVDYNERTTVAGNRGRVHHIFQPTRIAESGKALSRPLSVKERLQLQRAVAKKQARGG